MNSLTRFPLRTNFPTSLLDLFEDTFNRDLPVMQNTNLHVDIKEDAQQYTVHADVPGVAKDNIKINFDKGLLTIEVSSSSVKEDKDGEKVLRSERSFSKKTRSFQFGENIDDSNIKASYKDGVLTLDIPKREPVQTLRQIAIE